MWGDYMTNLEALRQLIDNHYKTYEVLKRKYGIIKKVLSYEKAIVTIEHDDMLVLQKEYRNRSPEEEANVKAEKGDVTLLNMTGEELKNGDSVWIHYWTTITSGYIAIVNGVSQSYTGGDLTVQKLAVLTTAQGNLYAHAKKYNSSSEWGSDYENTTWEENYDNRIMNIDTKNGIEIAQGEETHGYNVIFANGNPILIMHPTSDTFSELTLVNPNLFTHEMNVRISRNVIKSVFTSSGISTTVHSLDPNRDSKLYLAMRSFVPYVGTYSSTPRYYYGVMVEQDGIESIVFNCGKNYRYSNTAFEGLGFILMTWGDSNINAPNNTFPYGSVSAGCAVYDYYFSYNFDMTLGFQNNAEYEYAKCVLSSCNLHRITG